MYRHIPDHEILIRGLDEDCEPEMTYSTFYPSIDSVRVSEYTSDGLKLYLTKERGELFFPDGEEHYTNKYQCFIVMNEKY